MLNLTHTEKSEAMQRAIAKAKAVKPSVRFDRFRHYIVTNARGIEYRVIFSVNAQNGTRQAMCGCEAGRNGMLCYHVAAAYALHLGIQSMRVHAKMQREAQAASQAAQAAKMQRERELFAKVKALFDWETEKESLLNPPAHGGAAFGVVIADDAAPDEAVAPQEAKRAVIPGLMSYAARRAA